MIFIYSIRWHTNVYDGIRTHKQDKTFGEKEKQSALDFYRSHTFKEKIRRNGVVDASASLI